MPLTEAAIRNAKPKDKPYKLSDERSLFLLANPNGSKLFRFKYRFNGKEKVLALGAWPSLSLKEARNQREEARAALDRGEDPAAVKQAKKREQRLKATSSFESVAREYVNNQANRRSPRYKQDAIRRLEQNIFPDLAGKPIADVEPPELLDVLRKIENRGAHEMASRVRMLCGQVFRYGIATGRCKRDPAADLLGALIPHKVRHQPAVKPHELPELLRKIAAYDGEPVTRLGLQFMAYTFVRTSELIPAEWTEFNTNDGIWTVPGARMKMKSDHYVPLATQVLALLEELKAINGESRYVFAALNPRKHISNNTLLYALYRLGYKSRMTGHGFRAVASTILNEERERGSHVFGSDVIERQLDHCERDDIRGAYNRAQYIQQRRQMMQWWADYLGRLPA
ncbi:MAG: tyrosine-type recombinase/integrase [Rhodomicrobium sp.]